MKGLRGLNKPTGPGAVMAVCIPGPAGVCHVSRLSPSSPSRVDRPQISAARRLGSRFNGDSEKTLQIAFTEKQTLACAH